METSLNTDHSRKAKMPSKHAMLKIVLCLFTAIESTTAIGQDFSRDPDSTTLATMKNEAIHSAINYLEASLSNKQLVKQFIVDSNSSLVICDDYKTFFNSKTVYCFPVGYEIAFHILLENGNVSDTMHTNLFLPLASHFLKSKDSLADMWHIDLLNAWENILSNKFKFNYTDVMQFIKREKLQNHSIDFGYEDTGYKPNSKIYWFVTANNRKRDNRYLLYRIDPNTGAIKKKRLLPVKLENDVF